MFTGTYTAIVTPFKNGQVDEIAFRKLIQFQIDNGVDGIVPTGTTGEAATLDFDEHLRVIEIAVQEARGRCKIIAGTGSNSTQEAVELTQKAEELGVDAESVVEIFIADTKLNISPTYLKPGFAFGGSCLPKDVRALNYRAKELDLDLPLFQAIMPSNEEHLERAVEMVLATSKKKVALLGLSFKAATDDLRESPQVQLAKRLLGEGRDLKIWDDNVSLGHLIGSNRQYIDEVIPHVGSLLCQDLETALAEAEVVIIATRGIDRATLSQKIRPGQIVIDLVNLEKSRRIEHKGAYEGICW